MRLPAEFYLQDSLTLAQQLLGKYLVRKINGQKVVCKIVETEAYCGPEDKAAHTYNNRRTKRTEIAYASGGKAYIYMIYGMYYCLNIVANYPDIPHLVLLRACEPLTNIELLQQNRSRKSNRLIDLTNGPGKLCQALAIDHSFYGYDLIHGDLLYLTEGETPNPTDIIADKRINIDYAEEYRDKLWRFYLRNNPFVSRLKR